MAPRTVGECALLASLAGGLPGAVPALTVHLERLKDGHDAVFYLALSGLLAGIIVGAAVKAVLDRAYDFDAARTEAWAKPHRRFWAGVAFVASGLFSGLFCMLPIWLFR